MNRFIYCISVLWLGITQVYAQGGTGGGVYIENGKLIGTVVHDNQAEDGYGIAGNSTAVLLNCTVGENSRFVTDKKWTVVGDIYCADGTIVDTTTYMNDHRTDAIGVVYWINSDVSVTYPRGSVVALGQSQESWCASGGCQININYDPDSETGTGSSLGFESWLDEDCVGNTRRMCTAIDHMEYRAALYCNAYKASAQAGSATKDTLWCFGTLPQMQRLILVGKQVDATLKFLKRQHPDWQIDLFNRESQTKSWYWTSDDSVGEYDKAWAVNFYTMESSVNEMSLLKSNKYWVRPIFLY